MTTRGINFLDRWIANNIPEKTQTDVISVDELTHKLIADARFLGIRRDVTTLRGEHRLRHASVQDFREHEQARQ